MKAPPDKLEGHLRMKIAVITEGPEASVSLHVSEGLIHNDWFTDLGSLLHVSEGFQRHKSDSRIKPVCLIFHQLFINNHYLSHYICTKKIGKVHIAQGK